MKEYNEARSRRGLLFWQDADATFPWRPRVAQEKQLVTLQVFKYQIFLSRGIKIVFERVVAEASEILLCVVLESARLKRS
jgi:hypothetical protein